MRRLRLFCICFLLLTVGSGCETQSQVADLIFKNGQVLTVNKDFETGEAIAIKDGLVLSVGSNTDILNLSDSLTRIIDVEGRAILPGFIEPHTHPGIASYLNSWLDVGGLKHKTAKAALRALKKRADSTPKGQWILAFGWDMMLLDGAMPLTKDYLDKNVSSDHPIWVMMRSMHTHYFNSKAFELAGITDETKNPRGGGYYDKDENGKLTGIVTETAPLSPIIEVMPDLSRKEAMRLIRRQYTRYNSAGITTIGVMGLFDMFKGHSSQELCNEISKEEEKQLRVIVHEIGAGPVDTIPQDTNELYKVIGQKYWIDGSPYTGSMLMRRPYMTSDLNQEKLQIPEGSYGHAMFPGDTYKSFFANAHNKGWQISAHVQGDSAATIALRAFDFAMESAPRRGHRHRMEHLALVTEDQLEVMGQMGISPSFHINHIYYYGDDLASSIIGRGTAERLMPLRDALRYDHKISLHNDSPMYPANPLLAIRTAVTRRTSKNLILGKEQAISVEEAIKAVTIDAAWQLFMENEVGSLEPGKKADIVILEDNPLQVPASRIHQISVVATYLEGVKVY